MLTLYRRHRNFFLVVVGLVGFHVWEAWVAFTDSAYGHLVAPRIAAAASARTWTWAHLIVAGLMLGGLLGRRFTVARLGLALGCVMATWHALLVGMSWWVDGYLPAKMSFAHRALVALVHLAAAAEPTENPRTWR